MTIKMVVFLVLVLIPWLKFCRLVVKWTEFQLCIIIKISLVRMGGGGGGGEVCIIASGLNFSTRRKNHLQHSGKTKVFNSKISLYFLKRKQNDKKLL
jgi:hypothetical protein